MRTLRLFFDPGNGGGGAGGGNGGGTGGGGAPAGGGGTGGGEGGGSGKTVSWENFQNVVTAKNGLEAQVRQLQGQVQTLQEKAATVDTLSAQVNEWKGKAQEAEGRFTAFSEFSGALGTTDADVIGAFDGRYRSLPEKDRPSRADWVGTLRAKPDDAPALLRPWLGQAQGQAQGGKGGNPAPRPPATGATPPGAPAQYSAEEIARVREEAVKTGDWSKWKEMSKAMGIRR